MRRKILFVILIILLAGAALTVPRFASYYRALYFSPAIRYENRLFLASDTAGDARRYTDGESVITFSPAPDGTLVTLDFAYYAPASFTVTERRRTVTVSRADGAPALSGVWRDGALADPATGAPDPSYAFEILADGPSPSRALWLYQEQKDGIRGKAGVGSGILCCFCASFAGLTGLRFPRTKTEKQMLAASPRLRRGLLAFFCIFPFAAIPVILYGAIT